MTTTVVRYEGKADRADENQQLIEAVFAQLEEREPEGFTYKVFRLEDGVSFMGQRRQTRYGATPKRRPVSRYAVGWAQPARPARASAACCEHSVSASESAAVRSAALALRSAAAWLSS